MSLEGGQHNPISEVRLNKRYRAVVHKEQPICRQDVPADIYPGRLEVQRKRDGRIVGQLFVDLTGMFEVTEADKKQWRSMGQRFLENRSKNSR